MYLDISCNTYYSSGIVTGHHDCLMLLLLFSTMLTISHFIWVPITTTCTFISSFLPSHQFRNQQPFSHTVLSLFQETYKNCSKTIFSYLEIWSQAEARHCPWFLLIPLCCRHRAKLLPWPLSLPQLSAHGCCLGFKAQFHCLIYYFHRLISGNFELTAATNY